MLRLLAVAMLAAVSVPAPETTRALIIRCGGEKLIGTPVRGQTGPAREFVDQVEHARIRCHILQRNEIVPKDYDCDAGACEMVREIAKQSP